MKLITGEEARTGRIYFRAKDHSGDMGLLVNPLRIDRGVPGRNGPKDCIVCDIWAFQSAAQIQSGTPVELRGVSIDAPYVVEPFEPEIGNLLGPLLIQKRTNKEGTSTYWSVNWASPGSTGYAEMKEFALRLVESAAAQTAPPPAPPAPAAPAAQPMFEQVQAQQPAQPAAGGYAPPPPAPMSGTVPPPPPPAA